MKNIDFHAVEPHQAEIDRRLANWGKWCNGRSAPRISPMFQSIWVPPMKVRRDAEAPEKLDAMDAQRVHKGVAALPTAHRQAVNWAYVKPVNPRKAAQLLGTSLEGLAMLLRDGRQMLINRKV